MVILTFSNT